MVAIKMIGVESSNIDKVGYNPISDTLAIEFKGGKVYHYFDVPFETHVKLINAESIGKFLRAEIIGKYKFKQIIQ